MSKFKDKLLAMYEEYKIEGDADFYEWMMLHAETEHKRSVQMAGDLGAALSKIGDLEREVDRLHDEMPLPPPPKPEM